jgi:hypothetical protein
VVLTRPFRPSYRLHRTGASISGCLTTPSIPTAIYPRPLYWVLQTSCVPATTLGGSRSAVADAEYEPRYRWHGGSESDSDLVYTSR